MATVYGVNRTLINQNVPSEKATSGDQDAVLKCSYDEYDMAAVLTANDVIEMMVLPKGARIVDCIFTCPSMTTDGIFDVGTSDDQNYLIDQADAGGQAVTARGDTDAAGLGAVLSADTLIQILCTETTTASSGKLTLAVYYVID